MITINSLIRDISKGLGDIISSPFKFIEEQYELKLREKGECHLYKTGVCLGYEPSLTNNLMEIYCDTYPGILNESCSLVVAIGESNGKL
ncbi:MAG: hypothetical protein ABIB79_02490 [archaeon]